MFYRSSQKLFCLLKRFTFSHSDDKVLIVIGGDTYYKDDDEKDRSVISRWARRKVASQFNEEYLDGRKSFIFSWDKKHRPIHEEALRHYFDPSKKGLKFEPQSKEKVPTQSDGSSWDEEVTTTSTSQKNEVRIELIKLDLNALGDSVHAIYV